MKIKMESMEMDINIKNSVEKYFLIDSHLHLGYVAGFNLLNVSDDMIISIEKKTGIKKAICAHHAELATVDLGTDIFLKALEKYKDFLYGYIVFNPNHGAEELKKIKKYINHENIVGVKIHPSWHLCLPNDAKYYDFWKYAEENNIIVMTHSWNPNVANKSQKYSDPFNFEKVIKEFKNIRIILAHIGGRGDYLYKVIDLLEKHSNLYADFSGDVLEPFIIEEYVKRVGSERLLFGTDMPWTDARYHLINILHAGISEKDRVKILGLNASRLFGIKSK